MNIPFLDLARLHASIRDELDAATDEVMAASSFISGPHVARFEEAFAAAHGRAGSASCGSGTDALLLALLAAGVGPGDEVIVPASTFVATAEAVVNVGATPVLADVDPRTLLLTEASVAEARTPAVKAVIPVHLYGHVVTLELLDGWRNEGLLVVEDAAQAHLATWRDRLVGSAGQISAFSFYPGKNLGALGDGGAVVSDDVGLLEQVRALRDHGSTTRYIHERVGWCSRLDGLQAAWLTVKLAHLPKWTDARRRLADRYAAALPELVVPWEPGAVHHLLVVRVPRRDQVAERLRAEGIGTGVHYPLALSQQPALSSWRRPCPHAEKAANEILSLPLDPLMEDDQVDAVADALRRVLSS